MRLNEGRPYLRVYVECPRCDRPLSDHDEGGLRTCMLAMHSLGRSDERRAVVAWLRGICNQSDGYYYDQDMRRRAGSFADDIARGAHTLNEPL